jgi:transmembrane sensor
MSLFRNRSQATRGWNRTPLDIFVSMHSGEESPQDELDFADWCQNNPTRIDEYNELEDLWQQLALQNAKLDPEEIESYLPMAALNERKAKPNEFDSERFRRPAFAVAATILIAVTVLYFLQPFSAIGPLDYSTSRGERLVVSLPDNSTVNLNALTSIEVDYSAEERLITLVRGEASFEVAHDADRVFLVSTNKSLIQATGTMFNVDANTENVTLTVLEGSVIVSANKSQVARVEVSLTVGQQAVIDRNGKIEQRDVDKLEKVVAWQRGKIILSGESLMTAVEEVNRSSTHNIVVADTQIQQLAIYGVFNAGDVPSFVKAVVAAHPIRSQNDSDDETVLYFDGQTGN